MTQGPIVRAVKEWEDNWSVSRSAGPIADISFLQDDRDYTVMSNRMRWKESPQFIERRMLNRRCTD
jgi:hypothetical protein